MNPLVATRRAALITVALLLAGCFDVEQRLEIDQHSFSYTAVLRLDAKLAAIAEQRGDKDVCTSFVPSDTRIPEQVVLRREQVLEGGNRVCRFTLQGPTLAFEAVNRNRGRGIGDIEIERLDDRTLKLTNVLRMDENIPRDGRMLDALLAGRELKWSISAPRIVSSNGAISADGRRVDWAVPVAELFDGPQSFEAVFEYDPPWYARLLRSLLRLLDTVLDWIGLARK